MTRRHMLYAAGAVALIGAGAYLYCRYRAANVPGVDGTTTRLSTGTVADVVMRGTDIDAVKNAQAVKSASRIADKARYQMATPRKPVNKLAAFKPAKVVRFK